LLETAVAWRAGIERDDGPTCLLLSRQNLPAQPGGVARTAGAARGGYILADAENPQMILIATGSEVDLAMGARKLLAAHGVAARVVSMPSTTVFDRQDATYRGSVLPPGVSRVAVEAGVTAGWWRYVGRDGAVVGIDRFGESGQGSAVLEHFGFTADRVAETALAVIGNSNN
jgi:transketolase